MIILFFIISFFSCIIGAICGIGGGVIMKPVLDAFHIVGLGCLLIGLVLGMLSAFLGIGGGAINIMILCYFFSMGAKEAGLASLNIIMLSQLTSLTP